MRCRALCWLLAAGIAPLWRAGVGREPQGKQTVPHVTKVSLCNVNHTEHEGENVGWGHGVKTDLL